MIATPLLAALVLAAPAVTEPAASAASPATPAVTNEGGTSARRTVAVVAGGKGAALGARIALAVERHADSVLIPSPLVNEAIQLGGFKAGAPLNDAAALRVARLSGAQWLVVADAKSRICSTASASCNPVENTAAAVLAALTVPSPADAGPVDAAMAAYGTCRNSVEEELYKLAAKGGSKPAATMVPSCSMAVEKAAAFGPAKAALAAAKVLAGGPWSALTTLGPDGSDDGLVAGTLAHAVIGDYSVKVAARQVKLAEASSMAPRSVTLPYVEGEGYFRMDQFDAASEAFGRSLALAPDSTELLSRQSYALHARGRHADSMARAEKAAKVGDGVVELQVQYSARLMDVGRFGQAVEILEPIQAKDPKWGRVALRLGYAYLRLGRLPDSIRLLESVEKSTPRNSHEAADKAIALLDLAQALTRSGSMDQALTVLEKLKRQSGLMEIDLQDKDFDPLRSLPRFAKLLSP